MGLPEGGWPTTYELLPAPIERVLEIAGRFGRFVLRAPEVHDYMSEHFRGAEEMLDSQLYEQGRLEI